MTDERLLLHLHKLLHEDAKHKQGDMKNLQTQQVKDMNMLLDSVAIEEAFADFCKSQTDGFLACEPNTAPSEEDIEALKAMGITALCFPCIRFAENGKTAKGMWLAETTKGYKAVAAVFLSFGGQWKLWKIVVNPSTEDLPAKEYERLYPDPVEMPGMPPLGAGGPPPMGAGGPPMGGPGGADAAPFDPDARADVLDVDGDYSRLSKDMNMLMNMALPDFQKDIDEADALIEKCRKIVSPEYIAQRTKRVL